MQNANIDKKHIHQKFASNDYSDYKNKNKIHSKIYLKPILHKKESTIFIATETNFKIDKKESKNVKLLTEEGSY